MKLRFLHSPWPCAWSNQLSLTLCVGERVQPALVSMAAARGCWRKHILGKEGEVHLHWISSKWIIFFSPHHPLAPAPPPPPWRGEKGDGEINPRSRLSLCSRALCWWCILLSGRGRDEQASASSLMLPPPNPRAPPTKIVCERRGLFWERGEGRVVRSGFR